jgi:MFS family permease
MTGANVATPLYAVYAERFGFSSLVLTAIFATYAVVLVPALILFGRLSDRFGRRPVILAGLGVASVALVLFAFAESPAWLFGARALQGLAVGMISGAATAALVELEPDRSGRRAALFAGLAQAGGSAAGPLLAGVLAEWLPAPRTLCYLTALGATVVAAVLVLRLRDPADREPEPWRIEWPRIPREHRAAFARVALTAATVWATLALFLSIVPSYAAGLLGTQNLALLAAVAALALVASGAAQVAVSRVDTRRRLAAPALVLVALGLLGLIAAAPLHSLALLVLAAVAAGTGHGPAFVEAQHELSDLAPGDRRGEVTAAFIACIYFLVATAVIASGLLDEALPLSAAVGAVAGGLAVLALAAAAWQAGASPSRRP